jgi:hypothetical protein
MKIVVATPYIGNADFEHIAAVEKLPSNVVRVRIANCSLLDQARSALAALALSANPDLIVWVDSDIVFDDVSLVTLARKVTLQTPIVSGIYVTKDSKQAVVGFVGGAAPPMAGLRSATRVGFGFLAMLPSVLRRMGQDLPTVRLTACGGLEGKPYFLSLLRDGQYLSEDASFCVRALECGFPLYLAPEVCVLHNGRKQYSYTGNNEFRYLEEGSGGDGRTLAEP